MKYFNEDRLVIKSWCNEPENGAIEQARHLANLPFTVKQICLMPDTHQGYGMPIGGVIATDAVVIPNAVGVDIGCGMKAVKTNLHAESLTQEQLKAILGQIREAVPVGFKHHSTPHTLPEEPGLEDIHQFIVLREQWESARYQLGTLGGGNHFIEIQRDEEGIVWLMIHSGSRNLGKKVADHYNKVAQKFNAQWYSSVPKEWELAFLPRDSFEGKQYLREMEYCLQFAAANRNQITDLIEPIFYAVTKGLFLTAINIHHNYAAMENHFGQNVMVHRKGATRAQEYELGIIPGSQGTKSYIVRGKGNPDSFMSCSHGAGRRMGRKEAVRSLDFEAEVQALNDRGILHAIRSKEDLEEASGAYKDIDIVMAEQSDLVDIVHTLEPMAVVKG